jgi:hypothetical protein
MSCREQPSVMAQMGRLLALPTGTYTDLGLRAGAVRLSKRKRSVANPHRILEESHLEQPPRP